MSVTITTNAAVKAPAYSYTPIFWDVTSDRDTGESGAVLSVTFNGFNAHYEVPSLVGILAVGDIVRLSGFAVELNYNSLQEVKIIAGDFFTTNILFTDDDTGTMTRENNGFQIKAEIFVFESPITVDNVTNPGGGEVRVITATDHGYVVGDIVRHRNFVNYNGVFEVTGIDSPTNYRVVATFVAGPATGETLLGTIYGVKRQATVLPAATDTYRIATQGIVQTRISSDLIALGGSNIITPNDSSLLNHAVRFTEEFDDLDGFKKEGDELISPDRSFVNATRQQFENQTLDDFELTADTKRFLTNAPQNQLLQLGEEFQLSFLYDQLADIRIRYELFDNAGASLGITTLAVVPSVDERGIFPVNVLTNLTSRVDVWLFDSLGDSDVSERFTFLREDKCFLTPQRIWWFNRLGGFDAFTFTGRKTSKITSRKQTFKKNLPVGFDTKARGRTVLSVDARKPEESWSEFVDAPFLEWLGELYTSPDVFIEVDGNFFAIEVQSRNQSIEDTAKLDQARLIWTRANDPVIQGN